MLSDTEFAPWNIEKAIYGVWFEDKGEMESLILPKQKATKIP